MLASTQDLRERFVVPGPVASREDGEGDDIEVAFTRRDSVLVDARDFAAWILEGAAAGGAENGVADLVLA